MAEVVMSSRNMGCRINSMKAVVAMVAICRMTTLDLTIRIRLAIANRIRVCKFAFSSTLAGDWPRRSLFSIQYSVFSVQYSFRVQSEVVHTLGIWSRLLP